MENTIKELESLLVDGGDYFMTFKYDEGYSEAIIEYKKHTIGQDRKMLFDNKNIPDVIKLANELDEVKDSDEKEVVMGEIEKLI